MFSGFTPGRKNHGISKGPQSYFKQEQPLKKIQL